MLKAYRVQPGNDPSAVGCVLVFADKAQTARNLGYKYGPWGCTDAPFTSFRANHAPAWDKHHEDIMRFNGFEIPVIETNRDLPDHVPPFFYEGE